MHRIELAEGKKKKQLTEYSSGTIIITVKRIDAGWSSLEARRAHNPKVIGSNPIPATRRTVWQHAVRWAVFLF